MFSRSAAVELMQSPKVLHTRYAVEADRKQMSKFHLNNYINEACRFSNERKFQENHVHIWFPHFFSAELFSRGHHLITLTNADTIVGCVSIQQDVQDCDACSLTNLSVAEEHRRQGIGGYLLARALHLAREKFRLVRLCRLDTHNKDRPLMQISRKMYEAVGFKLCRDFEVPSTTQNNKVYLMCYELELKDCFVE